MDFFEKYYKDEKTLKQLVDDYNEPFDRVYYYSQLLINKAISTPDEMKEAILELGGIYASINAVSMSLEAERRNKELMLAERKRVDKTQKMDTCTTYENDIRYIGYFRKMGNIFSERCESCSKIISVLQTCLRGIEKEKNTPYD